MAKSDVYQSISALAPDALQKIIDRLEFRGKDPIFAAMRDAYLDRMDLGSCARVLDLGCGSGVATRALAVRPDFKGEIVGIDLSEALISAAKGFASDEGLSDRIEFRTGDCLNLEDPDESFDAVITHTLISHVSEPGGLIASAARVLKQGSPMAMFDGDYASIVFGAGEADANARIVEGILDAIVANPFVMRQLPGLFREQGLEIFGFLPDVYAEAGVGSFYVNMAESYIPLAVRAGTISQDVGADWLAGQKAALAQGAFFGACNYYAYLARKPA
jgi:SAM-dependent methyltransferase